jgi:hypothetical protein
MMLPLYVIDRHVLGAHDLFDTVLLGLCGVPLIALRVAVALWRSPHAWAVLLVRRLPTPLSRRLRRREAAIMAHAGLIEEASVATGSGQ